VYGGTHTKRKQNEEDEDAEIIDGGAEDIGEVKVGIKRKREFDTI